jgi:hypothetical protein
VCCGGAPERGEPYGGGAESMGSPESHRRRASAENTAVIVGSTNKEERKTRKRPRRTAISLGYRGCAREAGGRTGDAGNLARVRQPWRRNDDRDDDSRRSSSIPLGRR